MKIIYQKVNEIQDSIYKGTERVFLTIRSAILLNCSLSSLHILAASTLAPLSSFGSG